MFYRILTKNGVENTNIDGARDHNFNAGRRSGIVQGALNSGNLFLSANNTIALDTCELRLCGHRVVIDNAEYKTFYNQPSVPIRYSLVAQIIVSNNGESVSFDLKTQSSTTPLVQNDLDKNINGTYELEIGRFTQLTDGTLTDVVRTADLITGGGNNDSEYIRIGTVTTNKISPELDADVDIENTINPDDNKPQTNFTFNLPTPSGTVVSVAGEEKTSINTDTTPIASSENLITSGGVHDYPAVTFAESERQKSKNLFDYTKIKSLVYGVTQADGIFTINTQFYYPAINYDINLNQGVTYTFSLNIDSYSNSDGSGVNSEIVLFNADGDTDTKGVGGVNSTGRYSMTFTPVFDVVSVEIRPIRKENDTSTLTGTVSNLMICTGEDRDYQPYNGAIVHEKEIADVEHIETIYDVTNTSLNMGYSGGINGDLGTDIPYDFTKYKKVIATCCTEDIDTNQYSSMFSFELDLFKKTTNTTNPYRAIATVLNPYIVMSTDATTQLVCAIFEIGYSKTYFTYKAYLKNGENPAALLSNAKLIKLEGVY